MERRAIYKAVVEASDFIKKHAQMRAATEAMRKETERTQVSTDAATASQKENTRATDTSRKSVAGEAAARRDSSLSLAQHRAQIEKTVSSMKSYSNVEREVADRQGRLRVAQADLTASMDKYALVQNNTSSSERDRVHALYDVERAEYKVKEATSALGTETNKTSKDNDFFTQSLGRLTGGLTKGRIEGKNFAVVLKAMIPSAIVGAVRTLIGLLDSLAAGLVAMIPNLVQVTSLLAALPGGIAAIGAAVGSTVLGFSGIGGAVKAISDADRSAAEERTSSAQASVSAADAVASAEYSLAQAHQAVQDAQESLTAARRDALYALQDLRIEAQRTDLTERSAELNLTEARRHLAELQRATGTAAPTDVEYEQAQIAVKNAQLDVRDAKHQNERTQQELNEAEAEGISQSDQVIAAQRALADATHGVEEAQKSLTSATQSQTESLDAQSASAEKMKEAFRALSPVARDFARYIFSLRPLLDKLRASAQGGLLPGAQEGLRAIVTLFPIVQSAVRRMATIVGGFFSDFGRQLASPEWKRDWELIFRAGEQAIATVLPAFQHFADALRQVTIAARPLVQWMADLILQFSQWADRAATAGRETGSLTRYLDGAMAMAEQFGRILSNLWGALSNIGSAAKETGQSIWDSMETITQGWEDWTGSVEGSNQLQDWFERSRPVFAEVVAFLGDFAKAWADIARNSNESLVPFVRSLREDLLPALVRVFSEFTNVFGPVLVELLTNVADLMADLGSGGGAVVNFLRLLNWVVETIKDLVENVPGVKLLVSGLLNLAGTAGGLLLLGKVMKSFLIAPLIQLGGALFNTLRLLHAFSGLVQLAGFKQALIAMGGNFALVGNALVKFGPAIAGAADGFLAAVAPIAAFAYGAYQAWKQLKALNLLSEKPPDWRGFFQPAIDAMKLLAQVDKSTAGTFIGGLANVFGALNNTGGDTQAKFQAGFAAIRSEFNKGGISADQAAARIRALATELGVKIPQGADAFVASFGKVGASVVSWNHVIERSTELTAGQQQVFKEQIGTFFRHAGALTEDERASIAAALAAGDLAGAQRILAGAIGTSTDSFGLYKAVFGDSAAASAIFSKELVHLTDNFKGFDQVMGQSYSHFVAEGQAAFDQGTDAALAWVAQQKQILEEWKQAAQDNFNGVQDALDALVGKQHVSSEQILKDFDKQLDAMKNYGDLWKEVSERGGSDADALLEHVHDMGLDGIGILGALADANDKEFNRIVKKWNDGKEGAVDLAGGIDSQLTRSIDDLTAALNRIETDIRISLDLNTDPATRALQDFLDFLGESDVSLGHGGAARGTGGRRTNNPHTPPPSHRGGWTQDARGGGDSWKPPKADEVDIRTQKGEFVVRRGEAQRAENKPLLHAINRGEKVWDSPTFQRRLQTSEYHFGGEVSGSAKPVTSGVDKVRANIKDLVLRAKLKTPEYISTLGLPGVGGAPAGATPALAGIIPWVKSNFPSLSYGPVPGHTYTEGDGYSQHAYGNAVDIFGSAGEMMKMFTTTVHLAIQRAIRNVGNIIHAAKIWNVGGGLHPYTGTSNPHYDHVHLDMLPQYTGTPPGHPYGASSYSTGGRVTKDGDITAHRNEFILRSNAVEALGLARVEGLNRLRPEHSPFIRSMTEGASFGRPPALENPKLTRPGRVEGSETPGRLDLTFMLDGKILHRSEELHAREARIRLASRQ